VNISDNYHLVQNREWINNKCTENTAFQARIEIMNNKALKNLTAGGPYLQRFSVCERGDMKGGRNLVDINEQVRKTIYDYSNENNSLAANTANGF
jgi:hypothetical protein